MSRPPHENLVAVIFRLKKSFVRWRKCEKVNVPHRTRCPAFNLDCCWFKKTAVDLIKCLPKRWSFARVFFVRAVISTLVKHLLYYREPREVSTTHVFSRYTPVNSAHMWRVGNCFSAKFNARIFGRASLASDDDKDCSEMMARERCRKILNCQTSDVSFNFVSRIINKLDNNFFTYQVR